MSERKIVFIVPSLGAGGIERVVSNLSNYLFTKGIASITIICFAKKDPFYPISLGIDICYLPKTDFYFLDIIKKILSLRRLLKELKPDVAISFGSMYNSFFLLSALGLTVKKYVSDRSNPWRNSKFNLKRGGYERHDGLHHYFLKKWLYRTAHGILTQTKLSTKIETQSFGQEKVIYFPNPIERMPLSLQRKKIILHVGRFVESKGQLDLIEIYSRLPKYLQNDWELVFVGGGDNYLEKCKERVSQLNLSSRISFIGFEKDVTKWYSIAEVFAFTSYSEGFPNALAEAMAAGCAAITYNCDAGPSDIIENRVNGLLIAVGAKDEFITELISLLEDNNFRRQLQMESVKITEKFSVDKVIDKLVDEIL
ncbi:glycosyltransferase [Chryseotalea sanaruensis]|nr:glycosyltransferase [Chryseotalea sanaruensis]